MKSLRFKRNLSQLSVVEHVNNLGVKRNYQTRKFLAVNSKLDDVQKEFVEREYKLIQDKKSDLSRKDRDRIILLYKQQTMAEQKSEAL